MLRLASTITALVLAFAALFTTASCTPTVPDRAVEKQDCATVGRWTGAPPGDGAVWVRQMARAKESGNKDLDAAVRDLVVSLRQNESAGINSALGRVQKVCSSLGLWQTYH